MHATRAIITTTLLLLTIGCADSDGSATTAPPTTAPATSAVPTTAVATTTSSTAAPTTTVPAPAQPSVWPAAGVVLTTPEDAAAGFVREVLGVEPVLGDFQHGDARSGEITVLSPGEAGAPVPRGVVFLRRTGPGDGWFVIGAGSDLAAITVPATGDQVAAGPLPIEGIGEGFEATLVVRAFLADDPTTELDRQVVMAGNFGEPQPYRTTLDLSAAAAGDVVVLLVQGGVGLETDPGNFSAVPVVIRAG